MPCKWEIFQLVHDYSHCWVSFVHMNIYIKYICTLSVSMTWPWTIFILTEGWRSNSYIWVFWAFSFFVDHGCCTLVDRRLADLNRLGIQVCLPACFQEKRKCFWNGSSRSCRWSKPSRRSRGPGRRKWWASLAFCAVLTRLKYHWLMIAYIALFFALLSRLTALACASTWVTSFLWCVFWIATEVMYLSTGMAGATWNCWRLGASSVYTIQPCSMSLHAKPHVVLWQVSSVWPPQNKNTINKNKNISSSVSFSSFV